MDNGRVVAVQVHQAAQDLPGPALEHLIVYVLVPLAVPARGLDSVNWCPQGLSCINGGGTHCLRVPEVKYSVMKLTVWPLLSSQES